MSNMNTFAGFYNLPATAASAASTSEQIYKVPASGVYAGLPSPSQIAANWLVLPALAGDVNGGVLDVSRTFRVRVSGEINTAQSDAVTITFYQVTAAGFTAGPTATNSTGVNGLSGTAPATAAFSGKGNFSCELVVNWDSQSKIMNGYTFGLMNGTVRSATAITAVTSLNESDLNFAFTYKYGSTGTGNILGPLDFTIDRA
jgi:hypothetical protein